MKNGLEMINKQVHLEGGFKRGGRIRVVEGLQSRCSVLSDGTSESALTHEWNMISKVFFVADAETDVPVSSLNATGLPLMRICADEQSPHHGRSVCSPGVQCCLMERRVCVDS